MAFIGDREIRPLEPVGSWAYPCAYEQGAAALAHGLTGIGAEVHDDLPQQGCVAHDGKFAASIIFNDLQLRRHQGPQQADGIAHGSSQIDGFAFAIVHMSGEHENLPHHRSRPLRGLVCRL